ncbi:Gfo/Idh/MocA family protein [Thalassoglobus polymorphus]|uniref:Glucose--fructose oxidoreductase n=1 Tax=Thalassoglobus polymorphus TaxID=2527994 RepID=A0A517QNQ8_9PLAN|nr:Gfo/Idh/MocA family oxidoreductase [Thalassoglobus polymorphus]QDT33217.1 Glucose--fructose oxidoreductase precursor [Thalassoglobus polymorphus]
MKAAFLTHADGPHMSAYFSALANAKDCDEVVMADPSGRWKDDAKKTLGEKLTRTYTSYAELLEKESPKFCLVSIGADHAPPVIEAALNSGSNVFSEKPACVSLDQFEKLATLAESKHLELMMAFANRTNPESLEARQMIRKGRIGKIYSIDMHIVADQTRLTRPAYHKTWLADKSRAGGGHLIWLGIHWLDLAMYLTGTEVTEATGAVANVGGQPITAEDSAAAILRFSNGTLGTLNSGYYLDTGYHTQIRIWGSKGWINLDSTGEPKMTWYENKGPNAKQIQTFDAGKKPRGYSPMVARAISAIANDTPPPITTQESLNTMRTVFGIYEAAETGTQKTINTVPVPFQPQPL